MNINFVIRLKTMTERIQHIINEIKSKSESLQQQLRSEHERVNVLTEELSNLRQQNEGLSQDNADLRQEMVVLKTALEKSQEERVERVAEPVGDRNAQIDALVREIDYCIGQLKNNA